MPDGPIRITRPLLAVLAALLDAENHELHGWAIMKATGKAGPTIYKVLERLAQFEWVTSSWDEYTEPGKPRRRYYQLTRHGAARAAQLIEQRGSSRKPIDRARPSLGWCEA